MDKLNIETRRALKKLVKQRHTPRLRQRAQIILSLDDGLSHKEIIDTLKVSKEQVKRWKKRWATDPHVRSLQNVSLKRTSFE